MSIVVEHPEYWEQLRKGVSRAVNRPVGFVDPPAGEDLLPSGKLGRSYAIIYPITYSTAETGMEGPHSSINSVAQFSTFGATPKETRWLSNRIYEVMLKQGPNGDYVHPIFDEDVRVEWRLLDFLGMVQPTGHDMYMQTDTYRLRLA